MNRRSLNLLSFFFFAIALSFGCSGGAGTNSTSNSNSNSNTAPKDPRASESPATPSATPSRQLTEADVAKLKWLEGSWVGMDGDKPFYERIHFEGSTMVVDTMADGTFASVKDTSRFELKDGEFGNTVGESRSAASVITDTSVQFVPAPIRQPDGTFSSTVKGNLFRFEKQSDASWRAVLNTPAMKDKPAGEKVYEMKPWKPGVSKVPAPANKTAETPANKPAEAPANKPAAPPAR